MSIPHVTRDGSTDFQVALSDIHFPPNTPFLHYLGSADFQIIEVGERAEFVPKGVRLITSTHILSHPINFCTVLINLRHASTNM